MKSTIVCALGMLLSYWAALSVTAENWPAWRGPQGSGVSTEKMLPLNWSKTENVRWHVPLPGPGNSSPIVWGDRVFVSQAVEKENRRTLMCFNRTDGKLLWQKGVTYTEEERTQESNPDRGHTGYRWRARLRLLRLARRLRVRLHWQRSMAPRPR